MAKKRDPLGLSPHWHVDLRIESELPEDNVVGTRFLITTLFSSGAVASAIFAGWLAYRSYSLTNGIRDWEQRIEENRVEVNEVRRTRQRYLDESAKIDRAVALVKTPFSASELTSSLGRTLPPYMSIDSIEWNENGIVVRGITTPELERFREYLDVLAKDPEISPLVATIRNPVLQPVRGDSSRYDFEVILALRAPVR